MENKTGFKLGDDDSDEDIIDQSKSANTKKIDSFIKRNYGNDDDEYIIDDDVIEDEYF